MDWFEIVSKYYPKYYTVEQVKVFVVKNKITEEQFKMITEEDYTAQ